MTKKIEVELVILDSEQEKLTTFMCWFKWWSKEFAEKYHIAPYTVMTKKIDDNHSVQLLWLNIKTKDSLVLEREEYLKN